MAVTREEVAKLYVANFNRAPDKAGLDYWIYDGTSSTTSLTDLNAIAKAMQAGSEAESGVSSMTDTNYVISLYSSLFGRTVDSSDEGVVYWVSELTAGNVERANMIQTLILGAEADTGDADDAAVLANKTEVGIYYADTLELDGTDFSLSSITSDTATVTTAKASADDIADEIASAGTTYTLTNSTTPDNYTSLTTNNDTINALSGNSFGDVADILLDSSTADSDTANLFMTTNPNSGAIMTNVETVNLTLGGSVDVGAQISGTATFNISSLSDTNVLTLDSVANGTVINVVSTTVLGTTGQAADLKIDAASTSTPTVTIGLQASGTTELDIDGTSSTEFQVVNLIANSDSTVVLASGTDRETTGDKFVVSGTSDLVIKADAADMGADTTGSEVAVTIDATSHTGTLTYESATQIGSNEFIDATNFTNVDVIKLGTTSSLQGANTISGLSTGMTIELAADTAADTDDLTLTLETATATDDSVTVKINDTAALASFVMDDLTVTGINNVTINSTGSTATTAGAALTNTIADIETTTASSTLILSGDKDLTISELDSLFTTINASSATADITITMENTASDLSFTGGSGDDKIDMQALSTADDTLDGGAGDDTLAITGATAASTELMSTTLAAVISNFEILEVTDAMDIATASGDVTATLTNNSGINSIKFSGAVTVDSGDTLTVKGDSGMTVVLAAAMSGNSTGNDYIDFVITNAENANTDDTLNLELNDGSTAATVVDSFTIDGVENIVITQKDNHASNADTISNIDGQQLKTITLVGSEDSSEVAAQKMIITEVESTIVDTIDASSYEGAVTVTGLSDNLSESGATLTAGSGVFTATGGAGADSITGGAAQDVLKGGAGNDAINGGAEDDTLEGEGGIDTITGGAGSDTITLEFDTSMAASALIADIITDFTFGADGDVLDLTNFTAGDVDALAGTSTSTASSSSEVDLTSESVVAITNAVSSDWSDLVTVVEAAVVSASGEDAFILVSNGTDARVYGFVEAGTDTAVAAGELTLVVTLSGVTTSDFTNIVDANFTVA
jgi:Ca2+-binding RTX toxin-like protein